MIKSAITRASAVFVAALIVWATLQQHLEAAAPVVRDWASARIKLTRTACFGHCPVYSVEIAGNGSITYEGKRFVSVEGRRHATVAPERVRELVVKFIDAGFFGLLDRYETSITDQPTCIVTIALDGSKKSVIDYAGRLSGMPAVVTELEDAIDDTAGTARWIGARDTPR